VSEFNQIDKINNIEYANVATWSIFSRAVAPMKFRHGSMTGHEVHNYAPSHGRIIAFPVPMGQITAGERSGDILGNGGGLSCR
jgi:hypothetical protein